MEETKAMVEAASRELAESKAVLEDVANKIHKLADVILPEMHEQTKAIRAARMTATHEVSTYLVTLGDIRKFFLDKDHKAEIERLEHFVRLCKELDELKRSGVLDAVADVAIRLGCGEVSQEVG